MKILKLSTLQKIYFFLFLHLIIVIVDMFLHRFDFVFLFYSLISSIVLGLLGREIALHRLWSHRSFKTYRFIEYILMIPSILMLVGSSIISAGVHRSHHAYSDTAKDPDFYTSWTKALLFLRSNPLYFERRFVKDLIQDPLHIYCHKYYFYIHMTISILLLYILKIHLFAWIISLSIAINFFGYLLFHKICHTKNFIGNYRNFNTNDISHNNWLLFFVHPGYGLHNNHHQDTAQYHFGKISDQVDPVGFFIKYFLLKK